MKINLFSFILLFYSSPWKKGQGYKNRRHSILCALSCCRDVEAAKGVHVWNHANVVALSNRLLSQGIVRGMLAAWFVGFDKAKGAKGVAQLMGFEEVIL